MRKRMRMMECVIKICKRERDGVMKFNFKKEKERKTWDLKRERGKEVCVCGRREKRQRERGERKEEVCVLRWKGKQTERECVCESGVPPLSLSVFSFSFSFSPSPPWTNGTYGTM